MDKVFLGGTYNNTTWRDEIIPLLEVNYFNPIVEDWTPDCKAIEDSEKVYKCNIHAYVITSAMIGVYSIAEMVASSFDACKITYVQIVPDGFDKGQIKSLQACVDLINNETFGSAIISSDLNILINNINHE